MIASNEIASKNGATHPAIGGDGGSTPGYLTTRFDVLSAVKAIVCGWVTEEKAKKVVSWLASVAEDPNADPRARVAAANGIVSAIKVALDTDEKDRFASGEASSRIEIVDRRKPIPNWSERVPLSLNGAGHAED